MKLKRFLAVALSLALVFGMTACGSGKSEDEGNVLKIAESFAYPSLDTHKDYYGWFTSIYGISESLFRMDDNAEVQPVLAQDATLGADGLTWTVTLQDKAAFSNGTKLTSKMVIKNLKRLGKKNERFPQFGKFTYTVVDDHTFTITTPEVYPTLKNDLAMPEAGILDLDETKDIDNEPIGTGPFVIKSFEPEGTVEVSRNDNYWNGKVKLDGAIFYYMQDDDSKLQAMQNGEVDYYTAVTAASLEVLSKDTDKYTIANIPATRLQFYMLNQNTLDDNLRKAINLTVDCDAIAEYLKGTVSPAVGAFNTNSAYGKVTKPAVDTAAAKAAIEADGYTLNAKGIYEKDGKPLTIKIRYYEARSLDTLATLIQEQLKAIGIKSELKAEEDPDATYISTGDFDLALYCEIADINGDPYFFLNDVLRADSRWSKVDGFNNAECEQLISQLQTETDVNKRAELANRAMQIAIDNNAINCVGLFNEINAMTKNVQNVNENSPFDFYRIEANTEIK